MWYLCQCWQTITAKMATSQWHFPLSYHKMYECSGGNYICNLPVHVYIYIINVNYNSQYPVSKEFRSSLCQCDAYDSMPSAGLEISYRSRFLFPKIFMYLHGCIFKILSLTSRRGWFSPSSHVDFFTVLPSIVTTWKLASSKYNFIQGS